MVLKFGVPKREINKKEELFPNNSVIKMVAWEGKGFGKKLEFNFKAVELLKLIPGISNVNFAFDDEEKTAYVGKQDGEDSKTLAKNKSISDKKIYDYIVKNYNLDETVDNYLSLTDMIDLAGVKIYKLVSISTTTVETAIPTPVIDKEIEHMIDDGESPEYSEFKKESVFEPHGDSWV